MLHYQDMTDADLDGVVAAEARAHRFPWTRGNFADSLAAGHGAWVVREDGKMAAYAVMMQVLEELQRQGRGTSLLQHLFGVARARGLTRMLLEVRQGNASGLGLYRRHGFVEIGRRRDYYQAQEGREDAIVMAREL